MDNIWKKEFKNKMQDYQEIAPEGLWSEISSAMNIEPAKKKSIFPLFLRYSGAIAAAAVVVLGVFFYWNINDIEENEIIDIVPTEKNVYAHIPSDMSELSNMTDISDIQNTGADPKGGISQPSDKSTISNISEKRQNCSNKAASTSSDANIPQTQGIGNKNIKNAQKTDITTNPDNTTANMDIFDNFEEPYTPQKNKIKIGASITGTIGNISSQTGYATTVDAANITSFGSHPENEIRMFNRNKDVSSSTKYIQPVKVGLHFKGYITKRWSIGTGIEWTWLHSTLKEGSESYYTNTAQDIHYIGIPLNINFDIWQGTNLNVYAFAGGAVEKSIYGRNTTQYVFNHSATKSEINRLNERQLQWSVSAGAGIEYNFSKFAGIYVSPSVSWHFDNGSNIANIYKARPFNFSLSLGLRFHL